MDKQKNFPLRLFCWFTGALLMGVSGLEIVAAPKIGYFKTVQSASYRVKHIILR